MVGQSERSVPRIWNTIALMFGGAQAAPNRSEVSLWCWSPIGVSRIVRFCELDRCRQLRSFGMILTTHAIVGAALASFLPSHPAAAFVAGFASHFALDAIPHVDYPIKSRSVNPRIGAPMAFDRALLQDAATIGSDGPFGIMAALFLFSTTASFWAILMGAIGAMLPDPLQFVHTRLPHEPLRTLQRFHLWAHTKKRMTGVLGVGTQAAFVACVIGLTAAIHRGIFDSAFAMVHGTG
jgi:hypothetical protein